MTQSGERQRKDGKPLILLVEDNKDDEELMMVALGHSGVASDSVMIARDGEEALKLLLGLQQENTIACPKVVLLDLKLPKLNGFEVLERIRSNPRTVAIPVVIMTTSTEESDVRKSYKLGANSFIEKPVDFSRFREAVGQISKYWLTLNHQPG